MDMSPELPTGSAAEPATDVSAVQADGSVPAEAPVPDQGSSPEESPSKPRRRRLILMALVFVGVALSAGLWIYYLTTRQPITKLLPPAQPVLSRVLQPHYLFSIYGADSPVGVAVTPSGDRIYVAEGGGERAIRAFDADGKPLVAFVPPNTQLATRAPTYLALDRTGLVYVADRMVHGIVVYDAGGNYKRTISLPSADTSAPLGIRFAGDDLLVTDVAENQQRVLKLDLQGTQKLVVGAGIQMAFPNSAVVDSRGRIYVSDSNNAVVRGFDADGNQILTISGFNLPRGLEVDGYQRLHVVDTVAQEVKVFDVSQDKPELLYTFGDLGTGDGLFQYPNDIAWDDHERLYIADRANNRVQVWTY